MGTVGKKIVEVDVKKLIEMLNKALSDEWLAYYQYWTGANVIKGAAAHIAKTELVEHAQDELKHANMIIKRILELDGTPILHPKKWFNETNCGYEEPSNFSAKEILKQNIKGEQCAILVYQEILKFVKGKDDITYHMIFEILKDEVEHEDDLENILQEI